MNIEEIVRTYLKTNGYDGLCLPEQECGCRIDELFPCGDAPSNCQAGHLVINDNGDWIIAPGKEKKKPMIDYKIERCWFHKGLKCVVIAMEIGYRCGYVAVTEEHPLYGKRYSDEALKYIEVHGGITYSKAASEYPVNSKYVWWFGYECGHKGDGRDWRIMSKKHKEFHKNDYFLTKSTTVKDLNFCINECNSLAEQLAKANERFLLKWEKMKRFRSLMNRGKREVPGEK